MFEGFEVNGSPYARRNRSALKMTEAELRLIASAAINGDSSQPVNGYRTYIPHIGRRISR